MTTDTRAAADRRADARGEGTGTRAPEVAHAHERVLIPDELRVADGEAESTLRGGETPGVVTKSQHPNQADLTRARYLRDRVEQARPRFELQREWIGRVEEIRSDTFTATLTSRQSPGEIEHAEIELSEISPKQLDLLRPGAVFYWVFGYRDETYGQRWGVSSVIFRNVVDPSNEALANADEATRDALAALNLPATQEVD